MEIFVDSANINEIRKWKNYGVIDGATTNPSIMFKDGVYDIEKGAKDIAEVLDKLPLSIEVTSNNLDEMIEQARIFAKWARNIVIKIPVINSSGDPCLEVISTLESEGIPVNTTAIMSFNQLVLATKAGSTYVSIFAGRVSDEGKNASHLIKMSRDWLDLWNYKSKIIVGSIREVINIQEAAASGAHIITVPPQFLKKMVDHKYTRDTVRQFVDDASKSLEQMKQGPEHINVVKVPAYSNVKADVGKVSENGVIIEDIPNEIEVKKV